MISRENNVYDLREMLLACSNEERLVCLREISATRPRSPPTASDHRDGRWYRGDPFTGDPPDQTQGRFSIYDDDASTRAVIEDYSEKLNLPVPEKQTPFAEMERLAKLKMAGRGAGGGAA